MPSINIFHAEERRRGRVSKQARLCCGSSFSAPLDFLTVSRSGDHNLIRRPLLADCAAASANASARIPSLAPTSGAAPLETTVMK